MWTPWWPGRRLLSNLHNGQAPCQWPPTSCGTPTLSAPGESRQSAWGHPQTMRNNAMSDKRHSTASRLQKGGKGPHITISGHNSRAFLLPHRMKMREKRKMTKNGSTKNGRMKVDGHLKTLGCQSNFGFLSEVLHFNQPTELLRSAWWRVFNELLPHRSLQGIAIELLNEAVHISQQHATFLGSVARVCMPILLQCRSQV